MIVNTTGEIIQNGGSSYEETTLWSGMEYATDTQLNLDGNISDYDQINFQVYRKANNYPDQLISGVYLKSALTVGETIAILGYGNGDYLYMTISAYNKIVITAGYGESFSIRKIVGVKYCQEVV